MYREVRKTDREFLEGLGIEGEKIDLIMEKSNSEISRERLIHSAQSELSKRGVKNINAAMKLFDIDGLDSNSGADELIKKVDEFALENDFLFEEKAPKPIFAGAVNNSKENSVTKDEFAKMGYIERLKLFKEDPDTYRQLTQ